MMLLPGAAALLCPSLYCRVKHEGSPEPSVLSLEHSRHDAYSGRAGSAS